MTNDISSSESTETITSDQTQLQAAEGKTDAAAPRKHVTEHKEGGLAQLAATAICGNDITSSCLYVSALAILYAGRWAPLVLLLVAGVLYLFRSIYAEVVGALPLNGGAYNALLNTTSKFRASIAACLTILSYMATAVISAGEAMHYLHTVWSGLPVMEATIALLAFFMVLTIIGITESSKVAIAIFLFHLTTLSLLLGAGIYYVGTHGLETLQLNLITPTEGGLWTALFFGFAASLLGISGFESSANFVEEQAEGVFPQTLRNMWIAVTIFNPGMALLALALVPIPQVEQHQEALLAHMGLLSGNSWFANIISIDAMLVLSGAVLTSFVGVNGLIRRLALDRCLPQFLLKTNRRGTTHRIIIAFFLLSLSVLLITGGELKALAGVYTISFLAVMALFGIGNILLKWKRNKLPRSSVASLPSVLIAIAAVLTGLVGNAIMNPSYLIVFLEFFFPALLVIVIMLERITILQACLFLVKSLFMTFIKSMRAATQAIQAKIDQINAQQLVFFTRGDNLPNLNLVMQYVQNNEHSSRIKIVTVVQDEREVPPNLQRDLDFLNEAYPAIDIEFVVNIGTFNPALIQELSAKWNIPANLMFIGSPGDHLIYGLADLGGVRLII
ncbi:MAG: APC family permease [Candidatus Electrothrix aestuarii]|uniref:APC family permease n=1 Tax=Candidatus Electrothrix aestuarii TaxID=3062594 RepID=A0AAU8LR34_9BACT|nr:APC family permease [Candidatus Electrothrix aestuarii]WPD24733.1 MAG: APC family permease [Candidatus Electrothrix sp. GW3-3]